MSDPELVESNPGKHESCPDLLDFLRPIDSDGTTAQMRRQAPAGTAATAIGLGIHDKLTVPDAASTTMRQCGIRPAD
jgi:hypothetical protein